MFKFVKGYKAFDGLRQNQYGVTFKAGEFYESDNPIVVPGMYDPDKMNGYHMSIWLGNVFRFFDIEKEGIEVATVNGFGNCRKFEDDYNGYYDMYVCENLLVKKFLLRDEYANIILKEPIFSIKNFIRTFPMNEDEKKIFMNKFEKDIDIRNALLYYQYGEKDIYDKPRQLSLRK